MLNLKTTKGGAFCASVLVLVALACSLTGQSIITPPGVAVQQATTPQGQAFTMNCSTNVTCSVSGGVVTVASSGGGATGPSGPAGATGATGATGGGGGGGSTTATAFGSLPGTCTTGALYLFTDSAIQSALCGASNTYKYFVPGLGVVVPPLLGSFTAVNSPTTSTTNGGIVLTAPAAGADNYRLLMQPVATAPYTTTACVVNPMPAVQFLPVGIALYNGTALVGFTIYTDNVNGGFGVKAVKYLNLTTFAGYYATANFSGGNGFTCLRLKDDGTNRIFSWSNDPVNFITLFSVGDTDFITPTQIGLAVDSVNTGFPATAWYVHYLTTQP